MMFLISNFLFSDNSEYHAIISIPELNFTLSERNKDASLSMFNNYTYNLPYSPYIGFSAYSLKFEVLGSHEVHKCSDEKAQHCEQAPNNDDWGNWHEVAYEVLIEPTHEIMVLITQATSQGSGEPAHLRRLARAFAVRTREVWKQTKSLTENQTSSPTGWLCMHA